MRWPVIQTGTRRIVKRFAFWPVKVGKEWVWLEFYPVVQVYDPYSLQFTTNWRDLYFHEREH